MKIDTYEEKEVTEIKRIVTGSKTICDVCKQEIPERNQYYELTTGHHDWGNDSIESIEHFDICSPACLRQKLEVYIEDTR